MNLLEILAPAAAAAPNHLDPVKLFLDADLVVQVVMAGLLLASIWVWTIIISFAVRMANVRSSSDTYERDFWQAGDLDAFQKERGSGKVGAEIPSARVAGAGIAEWRRSTNGRAVDREGARQRLAGAMDTAVILEADRLSERLNFLATVGAVAPFVGLFGTVWGIMGTLSSYADGGFNIATVAPALSEALFATAIGLFAAIPAVIAYNRYSHRVNQFEARLQRFADRFHATLSRELETD
jgi:biopolymer transport protein TolQ